MLTLDTIRRAPKALLHDHLDGGLRPATLVELASGDRLRRAADGATRGAGGWSSSGAPTARASCATSRPSPTPSRVMQTREAIVRVAAECAQDLAARRRRLRRGPVRARTAPASAGSRSTRWSTRCSEGFREGAARGAGHHHGARTCSPRCARPRGRARSPSWWCGYRDEGSVGFDIAGAEAGFPPTRHQDAFHYIRARTATSPSTPARAFGLPVDPGGGAFCGARAARVTASASSTTSRVDRRRHRAPRPSRAVRPRPAHPARDVPVVQRPHRRGALDRGAPDRAAAAAAVPRHGEHRQPPHERRVDDPRVALLAEAFGVGLADMEWLTVNAMKSAFFPFDERLVLIGRWSSLATPACATPSENWTSTRHQAPAR